MPQGKSLRGARGGGKGKGVHAVRQGAAGKSPRGTRGCGKGKGAHAVRRGAAGKTPARHGEVRQG